MNKDTVLGLVRHGLTFGGGALATKGWADDAQVGELVGAVLTIIGVVWSIIEKRSRAAKTGDGTGGSGKVAGLLATAGLVALMAVGCGTTRLEPGGAYAPVDTNGVATIEPDYVFYITDSAFDLAWSTLDAAFRFERDNRAVLWKLSPEIKKGLDLVRPEAAMVWMQYATARTAYVRNPVPANLTPLQSALAKAQQLAATAAALLPKGTSAKTGL